MHKPQSMLTETWSSNAQINCGVSESIKQHCLCGA